MKYLRWLVAGVFVMSALASTSPAVATFTTIDVPGAVATLAQGINDHGQIVGEYLDGITGPGHGPLLDGTFTTIDVPGASFTVARGINNRGQIVGSADGHGFLLDRGTLTSIDVPGATSTDASGINDHGEIVGTYLNSSGGHNFLLDHGTFTTIDVPGAFLLGCCFRGINNRGQIVGYYDPHGFLLGVSVPGVVV